MKNNINKISTGYTLIESLVYITCTILIIFIFAELVNKLYGQLNNNLLNTRQNLELAVGFNILLNNLKLMPSAINNFKHIDKNSLIFKYKNTDIGWCIKSNNLYKYIGKYNIKNNSWAKKQTNLVISGIELINYTLVTKYNKNNKNNQVLGLKLKSKKFNAFVSSRIGKVI